MPHVYDGTDVEVPGSNFTIPEDEYTLEIVSVKERTSKDGHYQVEVKAVVDQGSHKGFPVKNYVTFSPAKKADGTPNKGAGMSVKFLKTIGQPWEGKFEINPQDWIGQKFNAFLAAEEYNGYTNMKIKWVKPVPVEEELQEAPEETAK